jgi:hypothetical protein
VWGKTPLRWPLAMAGLGFFVVAGGFAAADEDTKVMLYTCVVMGATLVGAWIYALGSHRYAGESEDPDSDNRISDTLGEPMPRPGVSLDSPDTPPTN